MRKVRLIKAIAAASLTIVALLGISACGESSPSSSPTEVGTGSVVDSDNESSADSQQDDVIGVTLSGDSFSLRDALQERPVVLWFWAPG